MSPHDEHPEAEQIRSIERERLRSLVQRDMTVAGALHADDFQLVTPSGNTYSKRQYLDAVSSGRLDYSVFEAVSEIEVRLYGDAAAIRYQSQINFISVTPTRQPGRCWHTDTYERRDGRWQVVWSQATAIQAG